MEHSEFQYGGYSIDEYGDAIREVAKLFKKYDLCQEIDLLNKDDLGLYEPVKKEHTWISVDEKPPDTGGKYLVFCHEKENGHRASIIQTARWHSAKKTWFAPMAFTTIHSVTHWMKLPAPPLE